MPKSRYTSKRTTTYAPRRRTGGPTVRKPYGGSRYGNDAFVKIEATEPLANGLLGNEVFATMRVNAGAPAAGNQFLGAQQEFIAFTQLYARYEVVGMKAETTLNARSTFAAANMAGGFAPTLATPAVFPSEQANASYPMQVDCNTQGQVSTLYYQYSKDLRNSGATFAVGTTQAYADADQGVIQFRGILGANTAANTVVGSIKFTWYVRFHGRTKPAGLIRPNKENEEPQSEMSYADLQN